MKLDEIGIKHTMNIVRGGLRDLEDSSFINNRPLMSDLCYLLEGYLKVFQRREWRLYSLEIAKEEINEQK